MPEEKILVVDDEIPNLQKLCLTFVHRYSVLSASSGREALELVRKNDGIARLEVPGVPFGLMEGAIYDEMEFRLESGDTLLPASDGTTDALNLKGEFYEDRRFTDSVCRHSQEAIPGFAGSLHSELREFVGGAEMSDDITMLALRRRH
jgi:serine phosphatase RsbU (regulator of sigma subunit)